MESTKRPRRVAAERAALRLGEGVVRRLSVNAAVQLIAEARGVIVMSGSGISASSGLSTFSAARDGLYERARKRYKLRHGMDLFQYWFYEERPSEALSFLAHMCEKARECSATATHEALVKLEAHGLVVRHYTMNIDGLHTKSGTTLWHDRDAAGRRGKTVELHGCLHELVDAVTGEVYAVDAASLARIKARKSAFVKGERPTPLYVVSTPADDDPPCRIRFRVMFYDDDGHDKIVDSDAVYGLIEADVALTDLVLWLGVSFEQSASCDYLRRVQKAADDAGTRLRHIVVNPSDEAAFNAKSTLDRSDAIFHVQATSDDFFAAFFVHNITLLNDPPKLLETSSREKDPDPPVVADSAASTTAGDDERRPLALSAPTATTTTTTPADPPSNEQQEQERTR